VPIGVPAANAGIYVLSKAYRPTGPGIIGEMFIAGDGLARGYFNRPDLTDERFCTVTDPRDGFSRLRLYKTGDLARWNSEGRLEFLGRADHQVKIGGAYRAGRDRSTTSQAPAGFRMRCRRHHHLGGETSDSNRLCRIARG
jgi:acyl-CoA synthetase (AMP-forming)/AMP-acid ligase II